LPNPRRIYRRIADSALPGRLIAHLIVVVLVAVASFAGVNASAGAETSGDTTGFLNLVSSVRGAGDQASPDAASTFEVLPADEAAFLNRGAPPEAAQIGPMPTPVALDPHATPLPAPGGGVATTSTGDVTSSAPSTRVAAPEPAVGSLVWPVPAGSISQYFHAGHLAIDIAADYGSQVLAAQDGVVLSAGWRGNGGGYVIEIDHGNGMQTLYNHLGSIWVTTGQAVFAGQGIAGVGCTGLCTGPHVHFVVIVNGVIDNPQRHF
jgi:murein DD-endopeptidase MepM/ murein hydrolase activator NlpD